MSKKVLLVTGASGQLATEYSLSMPLEDWDYLFMTRKELDISDINAINEVLDTQPINAILNLAAYTNVEKAEKEETEKCFNANAIGPKNLAIVCNERRLPLIHISTDYVFDGSKGAPYNETDLENPLNDYGRTKFVGEKWIQECHDWYYIIRVSWVYSNHSKNFFTTMLNLAQERTELNVVNDQFGSPTSTKEICKAIDTVLNRLDKNYTGVYHFSGIGRTNWKEFAAEIFNQCKVSIRVNGIPSSSYPSNVQRPNDTYMTSEKFSKVFGYRPLHWKSALLEIVADRKVIPIKVGDIVVAGSVEHVIVSTDWLKRIAKLSPVEDMKITIELPFDILVVNEK
jgi:dTDP-4-dehydrorhamnose reductase